MAWRPFLWQFVRKRQKCISILNVIIMCNLIIWFEKLYINIFLWLFVIIKYKVFIKKIYQVYVFFYLWKYLFRIYFAIADLEADFLMIVLFALIIVPFCQNFQLKFNNSLQLKPFFILHLLSMYVIACLKRLIKENDIYIYEYTVLLSYNLTLIPFPLFYPVINLTPILSYSPLCYPVNI